ncbi:MAG: PQQ-binding-like beta-propeller repeat protein [Vicinamibacterales bacterium]
MIRRMTGATAAVVCAAAAAFLQAQGRGGVEWTTSGFDAQRSAWVKTDPRLSPATLVKPGPFGPFKFLWKLKLEHDPKAVPALTAPILLDRLIGFRGFKSIAFVATASETVHAIDFDYGAPLWKYHINYSASPPPIVASTPECPGGLVAALSRPTSFASATAGGRGGGGGGARSGGGVGEPDKGAVTLAMAGQGRSGPAAAAAGAAAAPAAAAPGAQGAVPGSAASAAGNQPGGLPGGARQGGAGGGFVPGADAAYALGSDGYLHALNVQNGWDNTTPALFLPANTRAVGLIVATSDEGATAYAATTHGCGSQPDAVWAMDLASPQKTVTAFNVGSATIAGSSGPAIGRDGTVYIATADGTSPQSNSVFALEPKRLTRKASATVPGARFNTSPVVFAWKDKDALFVGGGGKVYAFDAGALGGAPLAVSASSGSPDYETGALASWTDAHGTRWVVAGGPRGVTAFKLVERDGRPAFESGWTSREIVSPLPPLVVNGVVFAVSSGTRAVPAVLYGLDAATGRELWSSLRSITSTVRGGLAAGQGNVYVPGADGVLYAFGFEIEK